MHAHEDDAWAARRRALEDCVEKLSPEERGLLRRRYALREPVQEMARRGRLAPNTLSKRLQRIRDRLYTCIEDALKGGCP